MPLSAIPSISGTARNAAILAEVMGFMTCGLSWHGLIVVTQGRGLLRLHEINFRGTEEMIREHEVPAWHRFCLKVALLVIAVAWVSFEFCWGVA